MQVLFFIGGMAIVGFIFSIVMYVVFAKSALPLQPEEEAAAMESQEEALEMEKTTA